MDSFNIIEVEKLEKSFKVFYDKGNTIKEKIVSGNRRKYRVRQVLNGISFEVKKGESIGLIGQNGSGKSTILKILTRIMYPDAGYVDIKGRVSSLLELGAGFHPDMSGKENIYINASIFGLTKKEIDERLEDIIAFSELGEFIDNPVRTYSSGMYMRLAFSVAINVNADILLIDEILAVGDAMFQEKCFNRLRELKAGGTTIVIVSHALGQIEQICDKSIWLQDGKIKLIGVPRDIHPFYLNYVMEQNIKKGNLDVNSEQKKEVKLSKASAKKVNSSENHDEETNVNDKKETGNGDVIIKEVLLLDPITKKSKQAFKTGEDMLLRVSYVRKNEALKQTVLGFNFIRNDGQYCYGSTNRIERLLDIKLENEGNIEILIKDLQLLKGKYDMDIALDNGISITYHYIFKAISFEIRSMYEELGVARVKHNWLCEFVEE